MTPGPGAIAEGTLLGVTANTLPDPGTVGFVTIVVIPVVVVLVVELPVTVAMRADVTTVVTVTVVIGPVGALPTGVDAKVDCGGGLALDTEVMLATPGGMVSAEFCAHGKWY